MLLIFYSFGIWMNVGGIEADPGIKFRFEKLISVTSCLGQCVLGQVRVELK